MQSILFQSFRSRLLMSTWLIVSIFGCTDPASNPPRPLLPGAPTEGSSNNPGTNPTLPIAPPVPTQPIDPASIEKIPQVGLATQFDFATWNIENFPKSDQSVEIAGKVLGRINVDLIALEEVASEVAFQQLLDTMPEYKGVLSPHEYGFNNYQKLAFIYRDADLELLDWELLFENQRYEFPRPPLQAHFRLKSASKQVDEEIYMIVVHLKATGDIESQNRREKANQLLEEYVTMLRTQKPNARVTLLGDFNERVTYPAGLNVFKPWLDKPENYSFHTQEPALMGEYSFISPSKPMIDHMISTSNIELNTVVVPKLETMVSAYRDLVSDHLPVIARMK